VALDGLIGVWVRPERVHRSHELVVLKMAGLVDDSLGFIGWGALLMVGTFFTIGGYIITNNMLNAMIDATRQRINV